MTNKEPTFRILHSQCRQVARALCIGFDPCLGGYVGSRPDSFDGETTFPHGRKWPLHACISPTPRSLSSVYPPFVIPYYSSCRLANCSASLYTQVNRPECVAELKTMRPNFPRRGLPFSSYGTNYPPGRALHAGLTPMSWATSKPHFCS
jgi:hypothetical protein